MRVKSNNLGVCVDQFFDTTIYIYIYIYIYENMAKGVNVVNNQKN